MKNIIDHLMRGVSVPTISTGSLSFLSGISTSVLSFFELNAATIGAVCTVVSLIAMIFFGIANGRKLDKSTDNSNRLDSIDEHIKQLIDKKEKPKKPKGK